MVNSSKTNTMKNQTSIKRVILLTSIGIILIIFSLTLFFVDPILMLANNQLRLANGTLLHDLIKQELEGPKIQYYLYNVTNADSYVAGDEAVLKVEEIGPFVYQEYRSNDDLEFNVEPGIMRYTPSHRSELLLEESVGKPEDFDLFLPNIALLSGLHLLSKYPFFFGQLFKVLTSNMKREAFPKINAQEYLWGNSDPLLNFVNTVVPGLVYFNSTGLMNRFYDVDARYRLTVGTSDLDKFQVKSVKRMIINKKMDLETISENTINYTNTYEGAGFPSRMTPDTPINIYRHSICRNMRIVYSGTRWMEYGADAFVYVFDEDNMNERTACDSKGWCPGGMLDLAPCYYGFPFAISKAHFLDTDPKIFERIEGLKPDRRFDDPTLLVDPNIGVTVEASIPIQLNLVLGDMSLLPQTKRLSNAFLPLAQTVIKHPKMRPEVKSQLRLMYTYGPYTLILGQLVFFITGVCLLGHAVKMCWFNKSPGLSNQSSVVSRAPLLK